MRSRISSANSGRTSLSTCCIGARNLVNPAISRTLAARILYQLHESEILVQLHVAVEKRQPGIICDKSYGSGSAATYADHVFHQPGHRFAPDFRDFERVPVQMQRVDVAGVLIIEAEFISLPSFTNQLFGTGEGLAVDRPAIEVDFMPRNLL